MKKTAQELSYVVRRSFESEEIVREKGFEEQSLIFGLKEDSRRSFQQDIVKYGYSKACEIFKERTGIQLTKQKEQDLFRHIFEYEHYDELINLKKDFSIKLFKALSIGSKSFKVDPDALNILDRQRQITKDYDAIYSHLIMCSGDIEVDLNYSSLSQNIKNFERPNKRVARVIVKGKNCFLQTTDTDAMLGDLVVLELATQEDIKNVFELMNTIL